ncbi:MAG: ComEC/Rec2 family competence protein [Rhizobiaceae bacterium]|nr:ComEC/Rec2 family competence protein [Rhizobiaceae bacterium]
MMSVETPAHDVSERHWFRAADDTLSGTVAPPVRKAAGGALSAAGRGNAGASAWPSIRRLPPLALRTARTGRGAIRSALALEIERGTPFLFVPVMVALGALVYFGLSFEPGWPPLLALLAICALAVVLLPSGRPSRYLVLAALLFAAGMVLAKAETWRAGTRMIGAEITTRLTGRVVSLERMDKARSRLTLQVERTERPSLRYAPERVRVTARAALPEDIAAGDRVEAVVRLRPPPGPVQPGSYDFSFEGYFDGIGASGFVLSGPVRLDPGEPSAADRFGAWIEGARARIADRIRSRIGGAEGEIAAALIVGVRAGIPAEASEALRRTGLYHVISISGLHMALVAGAVISAIRALFALFPTFSSRRPIRKYSAVAGILAIGAYLVISGAEVAAQRSFVMLAVMLAAVVFDRAALTMRNLAISATIVLVVSPHEVVGPSFQMSFAATAALVGAYALWSERRGRSSVRRGPATLLPPLLSRLLAVAAGIVMTSLIAGLATAAFGAWHFQRVSPLSVFANLGAMPIVSLIVVPTALLASLLMPLGLDGLPLAAMGWGLSAMLAVAEWFSQRSPIDAVGLVSGKGVALLTVALTLATVATTRLRWAALPFGVAGMLLLPVVKEPSVFLAEDGRLVAFRTAGGALAVNRPRPNAFTADSWMRSMRAHGYEKPVETPEGGGAASRDGFACEDGTCRAGLAGGETIVYTADVEAARNACGRARLIVLDDATLPLRCADQTVLTVTKRDLARFGSAAVYLHGAQPQIVYAASASARPWHDHRRFSREARGKPPYAARSRALAGSTADPSRGADAAGPGRSPPRRPANPSAAPGTPQ